MAQARLQLSFGVDYLDSLKVKESEGSEQIRVLAGTEGNPPQASLF
jgi:hypothetical protein